jgi:hypothetical protein
VARRKTGVWQGLLALVALAVVFFNAAAFWQTSVTLRSYQRDGARGCYAGGPPACLNWSQITVDSVTIPADPDHSAELTFEWDGNEYITVDFPHDVPLLHRVQKGWPVWVGYPTGGPVTAVTDDGVPADGMAVTQTSDSPIYRRTAPLAWLIAGACTAFFFGWRAVVVRTRSKVRTGQDRWLVATALLVVGSVMLAVAHYGSSTLDGSFSFGYVFVFAVVLAGQSVFLLVRRLPHPVPSLRPARRAPTATPAATPAASPAATPAAATRAATRAPTAPTRTARVASPAGGLAPRRIRRLLASAPRPPAPVGGVPAPAELTSLAATLALRIGTSPPDRVLIGARPAVELGVANTPGRQIDLSIGAPLVLALPRRDVRALVAHAIAVLGEPDRRLASALLSARRSLATTQPADAATAAFLERTDAFWRDIEERADQAAVLAVPPDVRVLVALVRAAVIARDFLSFSAGFVPTAESPTFPAALYSGWHSTFCRQMPGWWFDTACHPDDMADDAAEHPGLAGRWTKRPAGSVWSRPRAAGMVASLSTSDEVELARAYYAGTENIDASQLTPVGWSAYDADRMHRDSFYSPTQAASIMLGHHASPEEILSMVGEETGQWLVAAVREEVRHSLHWNADQTLVDRITDPAAFTTGTVLAGLVAETMHQAGYRHTDPLRPQLMNNPAGHRVDIHAVVTDALASAEGMERLRCLLLAGSTR